MGRAARCPGPDAGRRGARERAEQPYLGGVGVLVLVDEDGVVPGGELRPDVGLFGEQDSPVHELRVVQHPLGVQDVEVLGEEGRRRVPVGPAGPAGERGQGVRAQAEFPAARQHRADLVGEPAGGQAGAQFAGPLDAAAPVPFQFHLSGEQLADHDVLLRTGQQPQRIGEQFGVLVGTDERVAVGVEGGGERTGPPAQPGRHPVPQFDGRLAAEGEDENALRVAAPAHPPGDRLHEGRGLAGAGAREHQQRSAGVLGDRLLPRVEERRGRRLGRGAHQAVRAGVRPSGLPGERPEGRGGGAHMDRRFWWSC